jgi:predicted ATPase with chaperone activity
MANAETPVASLMPVAPRTVEDTGVNPDLVVQLVLKTLHLAGTLTGIELANRLGVVFQVLQPSLDVLKRQQHCEIVGNGGAGAQTFNYRISDAGRVRAALLLTQNHYVGKLPVPLDQYRQYLLDFRRHVPRRVTPDRVQEAFSHLVLSGRVLDQLGTAICGRHSLFVYGPPGNGKTVISQAVGRLMDGEIAIPHAVEVDGAIIRVFEPTKHTAVDAPRADGLFDEGVAFDRRWVQCKRPVVTLGGELSLESLDLSFSQATGFYHAPAQMVANGGVLVLDDFGRQRAAPRDLLNRWVVPLENGEDFLTLQTGLTIAVPLVLLVVFATNIRPAELVDEAFLRRIHHKVYAENPTREEFTRIFENYCRQVHVPFDRVVVDGLIDGQLYPRKVPFRGCQPRDLINQALAMADYRGLPRQLTPELLAAACDSCFVDDSDRLVGAGI